MAQRHVAMTLNVDGTQVAVLILAPAALRSPAPESAPPAGMLDVVAIEAFPAGTDFRAAFAWLDRRFAGERGLTGDGWELAVECSNPHHGRAFAEAAVAYGRGKWPFLIRRIEIVALDLPRPSREGWRMKVGRRDVAAVLTRLILKRLLFIPPGMAHAKELYRQVEAMRAKRPGDADAPEDLSSALGLAVWTATRGAVSPGGFVKLAGRPSPEVVP